MSAPLPPPGDRFRFTTIGHRDHGLCSPLSARKLERLLGRLDLPGGGTCLDLAGGKGLLARAVVERRGARALVVDSNPHFLAEGRAALADPDASPGLTADLEALVHTRARSQQAEGCSLAFLEGDVLERAADLAAFAPEGADLVACVGARPWGGRRASLAALLELARPGGLVLVGEGIWRRAPDAAFQAFLGVEDDPDELEVRFEDHPRLAAELGAELVWAHGASSAELTDYDQRFCAALLAWCELNPGDPEAEAFGQRIRAWDAEMARHGRAVMGFGWYLYRRP